MKPVLFFTAALVLAVGPALAQEAPAPAPAPAPPPTFFNAPQDTSAQFRLDMDLARRQCFSMEAVAGANRAGPKKLYVQGKDGRVLKLDLAEPCEALDQALSISLRGRGLSVCAGQAAILKVDTATGAKRCAIREVIRPTKKELQDLAMSAKRQGRSNERVLLAQGGR